MKTVKMIFAMWLVFMTAAIVIVSCEKDDTTTPTSDSQWEQVKQEGKALLQSSPQQKALPAEIIGKANLIKKAWGISNGRKWAIVDVKVNVYPSTIPVSAISLVIDYDETKVTAQPFNYGTLHPDITASLASGLGAVLGVTNLGKVYFIYYSITPMMFTPASNGYVLFRLTFTDITSPSVVNFDLTGQGNCEFSPDGWYVIPFTWTGVTL